MNIISAQNINYSTQGKEILKDISFLIEQGTFTAIVGMNGAGKTTLLKLLSGLIRPQNGKICLFDKDIQSYSTKQRSQKISIVFQNSNVEFDFSALQIVEMGRIPYQRLFSKPNPEDSLIAEDCMKKTGTFHLKNRLINTLSGGEKQRVFIAKALCQQTPIILLDEPVASLDLKHQGEIIRLLKDIQTSSNATLIVVLHDLSIALKYADKVLALKNGRIKFCDIPNKVLTEKNIDALFEVKSKIVNSTNVIIEK